MAELIVGHGPILSPPLSPYVPDFLIVRDDQGRKHVLSRQGRLSVTPEALAVSRKYGACTPEPLRTGLWPIVVVRADGSAESVEWLPLQTEMAWRTERARAIFANTKDVKGDPERVLAAMRASAALVSVDLDKIVRDLQSIVKPGESLSDAYDRSKR